MKPYIFVRRHISGPSATEYTDDNEYGICRTDDFALSKNAPSNTEMFCFLQWLLVQQNITGVVCPLRQSCVVFNSRRQLGQLRLFFIKPTSQQKLNMFSYIFSTLPNMNRLKQCQNVRLAAICRRPVEQPPLHWQVGLHQNELYPYQPPITSLWSVYRTGHMVSW